MLKKRKYNKYIFRQKLGKLKYAHQAEGKLFWGDSEMWRCVQCKAKLR